MKNQPDAKDDSSLIRNKKDPLKLRLEAITGEIEPRANSVPRQEASASI